jgi:hypothetical protein
MPTNFFYVMFVQGHWCIKYHNRKIGPFPSRQDAINAAIEAAQGSGCVGDETEVLVEAEDGSFRTIWTYGQEP